MRLPRRLGVGWVERRSFATCSPSDWWRCINEAFAPLASAPAGHARMLEIEASPCKLPAPRPPPRPWTWSSCSSSSAWGAVEGVELSELEDQDDARRKGGQGGREGKTIARPARAPVRSHKRPSASEIPPTSITLTEHE